MSDDGDSFEEIECPDCGHVIWRLDIGSPRCAGCLWLTWIDDADDRAKARAHLIAQGTIGEGVTRERAKRAYHDPTFPKRDCDGCGQPYTGPAVYCSIGCAERDR